MYKKKCKNSIGNIYLVRIKYGKVIPALIIEINDDGKILVAQLRKYTGKQENNTVYIGQLIGLKSESIVMAYKTHIIHSIDIIDYIAKVNLKKVTKVIEVYKTFLIKDELHQELHQLKKKILLAQFNNQDYSQYEKRLDDIISQLGYENVEEKQGNVYEKAFKSFREVPNKGYIKIYYGGR